MPQELLRESFRNSEALKLYTENGFILPSQLSQLLFQGVQRRNAKRPDYLIKNRQSLLLNTKGSSLSDFLLKVLNKLASRYVEPTTNGQLLVKTDLFSEWQELITEVPPIIAVAESLRERYGSPNIFSRAELLDYIEKVISPQVRYSVLPSIKDPRLDELIERLQLDDLHIHLNGSTEIEQVWRVALEKPKTFANELLWAKNNTLVKEQYNADELGLDQAEQFKRLKIAKILKGALLNKVLSLTKTTSKIDLTVINKAGNFITNDAIEQEGWQALDSFKNQLSHIDKKKMTPLTEETLFLILIFDYLSSHRNDDEFAQALYYYLLLKCQFMRLIVQQTQNIGFEQFQKITFNQMRRSTEVEFVSRFHQFSYKEKSDIALLEGRYAPSAELENNVATLKSILKDFDKFNREKKVNSTDNTVPYGLLDLLSSAKQSRGSLKLGLLAHFIKKPDSRMIKLKKGEHDFGWTCRQFSLRNEVEKTRRAMAALTDRYKGLNDYLFGFDAASNELDAGPETFAPVFRRLRANGYHNFTFHAGEDFVHLLSGIRTVAEAIDFLDLKTGNRIGHGTAIGINPSLWRDRIGSTLVMKQGERLDDLVFAYRILCERDIEGRILHLMEGEIRKLSAKIYKKGYLAQDLYDAWKLRYLDPILAFELKRAHSSYLRDDIRKELAHIETIKVEQEVAFEIFEKYHGINDTKYVSAYEELIEVDLTCPCENAFTHEIFRILQKYVLGKINRRHMAIESLPTSNVRISFYENHSEHHIFDWLGVTEEKGMEVPVVLGSDDPGIFSTNLRNEYAHILIELDKRLSSMDAIAKLEQIVRNGKIWRFKKLSY